VVIEFAQVTATKSHAFSRKMNSYSWITRTIKFKKYIMWSLNSIQLVDIFGGAFGVQPLQDFDLMVEGTKTHANLSHELHRQLKGDEILIDEIPKLDT